MQRNHSLFRPPAEAYSLIIRIANGCPWNQCTFCGMYKGVQCSFQSLEEIEHSISMAWKEYPQARRVFLADGDVMALPFNKLNMMQPRLLSALRVIPIPGTELCDEEQSGRFNQLTEFQAVEELRTMVQGLELESTVFRANHSSNILPMEGRFPKDKGRLLAELDALLASGSLDPESPGPPPLSL